MALRKPSSVRVERESVDDTIKRLETYVRRLEARYECSSNAMSTAVNAGDMRATAEVCRWLTADRTLARLKNDAGRAAGTSTTITE